MTQVAQHDGRRLRTDRGYRLDESPDRAWQALCRVEDYPRWWPWLRRLDADALAVGERWQARIRVPMPWSLRFTLHIVDVEPARRVAATVSGDIEGTATVALEPADIGATIHLCSDLSPRHRLLRLVHRLAPAVSRRLHDRVVDQAFRQFAERADAGGSRRRR